MKSNLFFAIIFVLLISCNQNSNKELELREREIAIKEKELGITQKDTLATKVGEQEVLKIKKDTIVKELPKTIEPKLDLPFIGKKYFNFAGGSGTGMAVEIFENGNIILGFVRTHGTLEDEKKYARLEHRKADLSELNIIYKGKFSKKIMYKSKEWGDGGYLIEKDKISELDKNGKVNLGCKEEDKPCVTYYED